MNDLREAVQAVREHEANLTNLVNGLLADLNRVIKSATEIKKALISEREGARVIVECLEDIEDMEQDWDRAQEFKDDEAKFRQVGLYVFKHMERMCKKIQSESITDDIVQSVATDILERSEELAEDIAVKAFGFTKSEAQRGARRIVKGQP